MKILLVLPAGQNVRVTRERPEVPKREMLRFSLLPLTIVAALTPPEHDVRIVDENVEPLDFELEVDLVGVTFMTALAPRAYEIAREFRQRGTVVIGGGYHPTLCSEEALRHFDAIVIGDAEGSWPRAIRDFEEGRLLKTYSCPPCSEKAPMHTPMPRRDLLTGTARHYVTIHAVQTGRGCRHGCRYCSVTAFHQQQYRHRPVSEVLRELSETPRDFIFVDDNIIADREYARELFRRLVPLHKRWVGQCSIEIADDADLLTLAAAAGCCGLFIGIETVNAENLALVKKEFNDSARYNCRLAKIRRAGIGVVAGVIVGLDHDEPGVFERTLEFLHEMRIDAVQLNILTPLPGTPLFAEMEQQGRITDRDWSHYDFRHVVFQPALMSREELQAGADWLYARFYGLDQILYRFFRNLARFRWMAALLGLKLGLTYRYDNRREKIIGWNPAAQSFGTAGTGRAVAGLASEAPEPVFGGASGGNRFMS